MHIEKSTKGRDLSPITDDLWKIFYRQLFRAESVDVVISGMKHKNVVFKWRKIYEEKAKERDEAQQKIVEKFRQRYAEDLAKQATDDDLIKLSEIEKHNLGQTFHLDPLSDVDNSPPSLLAVTGNENVHSLYNFLFNYRDVLRWGKNIVKSKTRTTKRAGVAVYNRASSLETLVGYLYLTDVKRLEQLMQRLGFSTGASSEFMADEIRMSFRRQPMEPEPSDHP